MHDDRDRLRADLRRAWFMRRLRRIREEETPPGTAPRLNLRERRMLRRMLREPDRPLPLGWASYTYLIAPETLSELGERLAPANLAYVRWIEGTRCLVLTEVGVQELPGILALYQSTSPLIVLLRRGPRAARTVWRLGRRDRRWRRRLKKEKKQELGADGRAPRSADGDPPGGSGDDDAGLLW